MSGHENEFHVSLHSLLKLDTLRYPPTFSVLSKPKDSSFVQVGHWIDRMHPRWSSWTTTSLQLLTLVMTLPAISNAQDVLTDAQISNVRARLAERALLRCVPALE
ncbi:hypothetical protein L218DRAFT_1010605 [Marasmius fiardii PR-910]|nr:hypothetical protein L218DRAFT_1010605 [Marasmius fiardii PR-910]